MNLDDFLDNLHYNVEKVTPSDWIVDWGDAPLPYKLYKELPTIQLSCPLSLEQKEKPPIPTLEELSTFLWYTFGLTQISQKLPFGENMEAPPTYRRFVPSGGALYPNELYLYLKIEGVSSGIYHYDVAHHCLVHLREGNFDEYLSHTLGNSCDFTNSFGTIFVTTVFWKNFFKYNNFSYRLQGLDAGFLIGQLLEVGKRLNIGADVCYTFLDDAINHLLGISATEESSYAVIPLSANKTKKGPYLSATELTKTIPSITHTTYTRSKVIGEYPLLVDMNKACMLEHFPSLPPEDLPDLTENPGTLLFLPPKEKVIYDFSVACQNRWSPGTNFSLKEVTQQQLSTILSEAISETIYRNEYRISISCCCYNLKGIPNGSFRYNPLVHGLEKIADGDFRSLLQKGLVTDAVNMSQVPLSFNIVGDKEYGGEKYGYRGYRIQQMMAGILSQRLLLAASSMKMNGHPLLAFDVATYDKIYQLDSKQISLLQIPVGHFSTYPRLQGSLQS